MTEQRTPHLRKLYSAYEVNSRKVIMVAIKNERKNVLTVYLFTLIISYDFQTGMKLHFSSYCLKLCSCFSASLRSFTSSSSKNYMVLDMDDLITTGLTVQTATVLY